MSSVSFIAGDTSWTDSVTCDLCGKKSQRSGTGEMKRAALPISDPRSQGPYGRADYPPEIEYEQRLFGPDAMLGWGYFLAMHSVEVKDGTKDHQMDFCPACCAVVSDMILEKAGEWGTYTDEKYGKEVPPEPVTGQYVPQTHAEIAAQAATLGYEPPIPPSQPLPLLSAGPIPPGPCIWREGNGSTQICGRSSMPGQWHCFEHAARDR